MFHIAVEKPSVELIKEMGMSTWPIWKKEVSEFDWIYEDKETCLILQGKAIVSGNDCNTVTFGAGDMVVFPKGLSCKWQITEPICKHYKFGE